MKTNFDAWENALTNLGVSGKDPALSTTFSKDTKMNDAVLSQIYSAGGFAGKIVDIIPDEMTKKWISIPEDTDGLTLDYLTLIKAKQSINEALKWSRLFGGACIVINVDDGQELEFPVNPNLIKTVKNLQVFDKRQMTIKAYNEDNTVNMYELNNLSADKEKSQFDIHSSRVMYFDGLKLPEQERLKNNGFGQSVLQRYWTELSGLGTVMSATAFITKEFNQGLLEIEGLTEMLATDEGITSIKTRMEIMQYSKSVINMILLDANKEKYTEMSKNVSGLPDLIDRFEGALSGVSDIPETRLFGRSPSGMNATGQSDADNMRSNVESAQEDKLLPELTKLITYITLSKDAKFKGPFTIEFNPLYSPSAKETAETRYIVAQSDNLYIMNDTLQPQEVAESRFGGDTYSQETVLTTESREFTNSEKDDDNT